jgi:hypothetical protein
MPMHFGPTGDLKTNSHLCTICRTTCVKIQVTVWVAHFRVPKEYNLSLVFCKSFYLRGVGP